MGGIAEVKGAAMLDGDLSITESNAEKMRRIIEAYSESVEEAALLADMLGVAA